MDTDEEDTSSDRESVILIKAAVKDALQPTLEALKQQTDILSQIIDNDKKSLSQPSALRQQISSETLHQQQIAITALNQQIETLTQIITGNAQTKSNASNAGIYAAIATLAATYGINELYKWHKKRTPKVDDCQQDVYSNVKNQRTAS